MMTTKPTMARNLVHLRMLSRLTFDNSDTFQFVGLTCLPKAFLINVSFFHNAKFKVDIFPYKDSTNRVQNKIILIIFYAEAQPIFFNHGWKR